MKNLQNTATVDVKNPQFSHSSLRSEEPSQYIVLLSKMPKAKSHQDFCGSLCLCCLRKTADLRQVRSSQQTNSLLLKQINYEDLLYKHFWSDYNAGNPDLPSVICSSCRKKLVQSEKDKQTHFKARPQYEGKTNLIKKNIIM